MPQVPRTPSAPADSPAESIDSFAANYLINCTGTENPLLEGPSLRSFCECTAGNLKNKLSITEAKSIGQQTPEGQSARTRMLTDVYAPCMQYPVHALIYKNCISKPEVQAAAPAPEATCNCMAGGMAKYVAQYGPATIEQSVKINPDSADPLESLTNSPEFDAESRRVLMGCILGKQ